MASPELVPVRLTRIDAKSNNTARAFAPGEMAYADRRHFRNTHQARKTGLRYPDGVALTYSTSVRYRISPSEMQARFFRNHLRGMGEIIKFRKPSLKAQAEGKTLCKSGFHKWKVVSERKFDVKQGKLVTLRRCERCGKEQTILR